MKIAAFTACRRDTLGAMRPVACGARLLALLGAFALAACAGDDAPPPPPTEIVAQVAAVDSLNPDGQGRASPLVVRLYELTAASPFESADFFDIYDQDQATLGATLVAQDEIRIQPAQTKTVTRTLEDRTRFIGVVAAFRDVELSTWRDIVEVPLNSTTTYDLTLASLRISRKPAAQ